MNLRKLYEKDAPLMMEWMHDKDVTFWLGKNFLNRTLEDCQLFIAEAQNDEQNVHLAIVDDDDTYQGTVSLKNISSLHKTAEFAIVLRKLAMGKGFSNYAMKRILQEGFLVYGLDEIYWYVSKENVRAIRFYDKNGYRRTNPSQLHIDVEPENGMEGLYWYREVKERFYWERRDIHRGQSSGCDYRALSYRRTGE